jgi:hypothetical protein
LGLTGSETEAVCKTVFPALTFPGPPTITTIVPDLAKKQVLKAELESTGKNCDGFVADAGKIFTRFCTPNPGTFDPEEGPECVLNKQAIAGTTTPGLEVEMEVSPQSINVKCGDNKDNGKVRFTIFGSDSLAVTLIDVASLELEGVGEGLTCDPPRFVDKDNFLDLKCQVPSCPDLGPALELKRGSNRTVNIELTGSLLPGSLSEGLLIHGEETVKTSPPPK